MLNYQSPLSRQENGARGHNSFTTMSKSLMEQFQDIKKQYPDALLLFRCGDFYEIYHEDADNASKVLNITLTHRDDGVHLCGFPFHALDGYLPKLVRAGFRVAICDKLEEPEKKDKETKQPKPEPDTQLSLSFFGEDKKREYLYRFRDRVAMEILVRNFGSCSEEDAARAANTLVYRLYGYKLSVNEGAI